MKKLYTLLFLIVGCCFYSINIFGQTCPTLSFSYSTSESRCTSTGSITVTATSGSGNYNYKVSGPVSTPFTSSNIITGLQPGTYQLTVRDVTNNCENTETNVIVAGTYADPRFLLNKTDVTCLGNDGTIDVYDIQYGLAPFDYTIISPSPSNVGVNNNTGHFTNLIPGEYAIQLRDSCGGIQVRRVTIENYSWWFDNVAVTKISCDSADATITLRDNKGNFNSGALSFSGFSYGMVKTVGDTLWKTSKSFRFYIGTNRTIGFVAKDNCVNIIPSSWNVPNSTKPSLNASVSVTNINCSSFSASVTGQQNLTGPNYCLIDNSNNVVACNSTGSFDNIPFGSYCIRTIESCYDTTITRCFTQLKPVPGVAANITMDTYTCNNFRARVTGQTNLTNPNFCLYDNTNTLISCNTSGTFLTVPYGSYTITIQNGCADTTITRTFSAVKPLPVLTTVSHGNRTCSTFTATATGSNLSSPQYCLFDTSGNVISCNTTGVFNSLAHGNYCIRAISCGDSTNAICFSSSAPVASVTMPSIINLTCTSFETRVTGQTNLTNPDYCIYDSTNALVECNTTGIFPDLPYGAYCIKITDGCIDTTITRCIDVSPPTPSINGTIAKSDLGCTTFTATVSGNNLTNPSYSIYDAANTLVATNGTGIFPNLGYGSYCAEIHDGCIDTTMRICETVSLNQSIAVSTSKTCTFDYTSLQIDFSNSIAPFTMNIYHPNGSLVHTANTNNNSTTITTLPALAAGLKYKVVGLDNCGFKDSVLVTPEATHITKSATATSKCPSSTWQNGSGNITVNCASNLYAVTPSIIKKDGAVLNLNYSSNSGNNFVFSDVGPGSYVIEYSMQNCSGKMHDTVVVAPYSYPTQDKSAIYQCDNNSFSVGAVVNGGVGPYQYEIIGSTPSSPSINTAPQASPVFSINNGVTYSLIRLRTTDACGNATLNDVSVLPLQNIGVTANTTCLYSDVTLSVDTIPNATYKWYYKRSATDSSFLDDSIVYNLPFLLPEETGTYVCKVSVNNDCITRLAYFELTGDCGHVLLDNSFQLKAKTINHQVELSWKTNNSNHLQYVLERKSKSALYEPIAKLYVQPSGSYSFIDDNAAEGINSYRVKILGKTSKAYTNQATINGGIRHMVAYPNPVSNRLTISVKGTSEKYKLQLINISGYIVYQEEIKNVIMGQHIVNRTSSIKAGIYLLKLIDEHGVIHTQKILFK